MEGCYLKGKIIMHGVSIPHSSAMVFFVFFLVFNNIGKSWFWMMSWVSFSNDENMADVAHNLLGMGRSRKWNIR